MSIADCIKQLDGEPPLLTQSDLELIKDIISVINEKILKGNHVAQNEERNLELIKELTFINEQLSIIIRRLRSAPEAKKKFLDTYPKWEELRKDGIKQLKEIAKSINEDRYNCNISKLVGYGVSAIGGILCATSAFLIPVTLGLSTPLSVAGGSILAVGSTTAVGTSVREVIRLKIQLNKAKKIINEDKELFQKMNSWLEHAEDLVKALSEIMKIDIVKDATESLKKLVKQSRQIPDRAERMKYFNETLDSIIRKLAKKYGLLHVIVAELLPPLVILTVLFSKMENRVVFDGAFSFIKGLLNITQLLDDAFDLVKLSRFFNINGVFSKAIFHGVVAAAGLALDVIGIVLTSIDVHKGSISPQAENILTAAEKMEEEADKVKNAYENIRLNI